MHVHQNGLSATVRAVILQHLMDRRGVWPVSVGRAIAVVREKCPNCSLSDRVLSDAVAEEAIEIGLDVDFDRVERPLGF
jgi:hypothetical protein